MKKWLILTKNVEKGGGKTDKNIEKTPKSVKTCQITHLCQIW